MFYSHTKHRIVHFKMLYPTLRKLLSEFFHKLFRIHFVMRFSFQLLIICLYYETFVKSCELKKTLCTNVSWIVHIIIRISIYTVSDALVVVISNLVSPTHSRLCVCSWEAFMCVFGYSKRFVEECCNRALSVNERHLTG